LELLHIRSNAVRVPDAHLDEVAASDAAGNIGPASQVSATIVGPRVADLNGDGVVNLLDMQLVISAVSNATYSSTVDLNQDGVVNLFDVMKVIADWG
jgi:hypothetical protein